MKKILLLHGPNLNLLGEREPKIYGNITLKQINEWAFAYLEKYNIGIQSYQSNHEGNLVDILQESRKWADGIIFNPGAYAHTSIALYDTILAIQLPVIEVHISNTHTREEFRKKLILSPVCLGQIVGLGWRGYFLAMDYFLRYWQIISDYSSEIHGENFRSSV